MSPAAVTASPPGSHCRSPGKTDALRWSVQSSSQPPETPEYHVREIPIFKQLGGLNICTKQVTSWRARGMIPLCLYDSVDPVIV